MFSASLEVVLSVSYREAASREHAYLTLEHLLYALAHDVEGEAILGACGANLPQLREDLQDYLESSVEHWKRGHERQPEQTAAFQRVLQTAVLHVQSAGRQEVKAGDVLAESSISSRNRMRPSCSTRSTSRVSTSLNTSRTA